MVQLSIWFGTPKRMCILLFGTDKYVQIPSRFPKKCDSVTQIELNELIKNKDENYDWKYRHTGKRTLQASQGSWLG